jgi:hypothetical protein
MRQIGYSMLNGKERFLERIEARVEKLADHFVHAAIEIRNPLLEFVLLYVAETCVPVTSGSAAGGIEVVYRSAISPMGRKVDERVICKLP